MFPNLEKKIGEQEHSVSLTTRVITPGRLCGPIDSPKVDTRSRESKSGPYDCDAEAPGGNDF